MSLMSRSICFGGRGNLFQRYLNTKQVFLVDFFTYTYELIFLVTYVLARSQLAK